MRNAVYHHPRRRNTINELPLWQAADRSRIRALPLPARRLVARLGMSASMAASIAELAGFYMGGDR
jgi:hypothetical protein